MRSLNALLVVAALVLPAPLARAQEGAPESAEAAAELPTTRPTLALYLGLGKAVELNGSTDVDVGTVTFRWSRTLGSRRILGGEPGWGVEIGSFVFDQEPIAVGFGGHVIYEHRFAPDAAARPVVRLGTGVLASNRPVPPGETHHNFSLFAELGLDIATAPGRRLHVGYRLHHVSNADTGARNLGINANTLVLGFSWTPGS